MNTTQEAVDREVLARLAELGGEDDPGFLSTLLEMYLVDSADLLAELRKAGAAGDVAALSRHAHALKGSSANVGAHVVAACCRELERVVAEGRASEASATVDAVATAHAAAEIALRAEIQRHASTT